VCSAQTRWVELQGNSFEPSVFRALANNSVLELPRVTLERSQTLDGSAANGSPRVDIPDDSTKPLESGVRLVSGELLEFRTSPELGLQPGIYSIRVRNPSGHEGVAQNALLVVGPPRIDSAVLEATDGGVDEARMTLQGVFVRLYGVDTRITVAGQDYVPFEVHDCVDIPFSIPNSTLCAQVRIHGAPGTLDAPGAASMVSATNPPPADCSSTSP
jgi:hypothetical protein